MPNVLIADGNTNHKIRMQLSLNDTIAAIATPMGEGGISVIRISGKDAFIIASRIFFKHKDASDTVNVQELHSHTVHFGFIIKEEKLVDECLLTIFKSPHSYTGEDVIEISCHGGSFVAGKVLSLILSSGARMADPGEFTKRAFLNGKLDLSQAEAVADLIRSKTESAHESSLKQLEGELSRFVAFARAELIRITSLVELELDFAEEGLELVSKKEVKGLIDELSKKIAGIISSYVAGKVIREGVSLVIAGKPNSGKSSLFNKLLDSDRAIVSGIAGTTRDYIEENLVINGVLFKLIDTAGIRSSNDEIESEGIIRSYKKIAEADLALYLIDSGLSVNEAGEEEEKFRESFDVDKSILVYSKSDVAQHKVPGNAINVSIFDESTLKSLRNKMTEKALSTQRNLSTGEIVLTNLRHKLCLENVMTSLANAGSSIDSGVSGEFISVDLRAAMNHLGEITGEITNDEILNNIFGSFCIGK
jgi:tRNA modification GTPase